MPTVGVLALQGGVTPHLLTLAEIGCETRLVRHAEQLEGLDGLVLPGGESTTQLKLLAREPALAEALDAFVRSGRPVLATCAGLILAARKVEGGQRCWGWLDVEVVRNGWGEQIESGFGQLDGTGRQVLLIRAPRISAVGPKVEVEGTLNGEPVLVRQGPIYGATFHPELTRDTDLYRQVFSFG